MLLTAIMVRVCTTAKPPVVQKSTPFFRGLPPVVNIAHRGSSESAPEHTVEAYELALRQGADVLELDVRSTLDGVLLVAHDANLQRILGLDLVIAEHAFEELAARAGARCPPRLEDVLVRYPRVRFNLELKDETLDAAGALARVLEKTASGDRVLVASAHAPVLTEFRQLTDSRVPTSASMNEALQFVFCRLMGSACAVRFVALQLPAISWLGLTDRDFLNDAHALGLVVHYWTIDDARQQRALIDAGADGIMTNRPGQLSQVLAQREKR